ncbi:MAG: NAD(P)-dependent oxidoreductase [Burkholderiales bacterium]
MALALGVARRVAETDRRIRLDGTVDRTKFLGVELGGKTVGVIGMGNIGLCTARKFYAAEVIIRQLFGNRPAEPPATSYHLLETQQEPK